MAISKVVSIEITDEVTRLCEVSCDKKVPVIYRSAVFANPRGMVEDSIVSNTEGYVELLKENIKKAGIRCKDVVFVVAGSRILSREITMPIMKDKLIANYIEGEKEQYFPMDISGHRLAYCVIGRDNESKQLRLIVYAAPEEVISNYSALAKELGMNIAAIDSSGNAMYQWLHSNTSSGMDFYIQINENNTMITILEKGKFALQRNMNFGADTLRELLLDEEYYDGISKEEAGKRLSQEEFLYHSFAEMEEHEPLDADDARLHECKRRLTEAVRPMIAGFTRMLEYYHTKNREASISVVYVGGCGSRVRGIDKLIMSEFEDLDIKIVNSLPNIKYNRKDPVMNRRSTEFMACIGASYRSLDFGRVTDIKDKKSAASFTVLAAVLTLAAAGAIVGVPLIEYNSALNRQKQLKEDIASLQYIADLKAEADSKALIYGELKAFDESTVTHSQDWNNMLKQFEQAFPSEMQVTSLTSNEEGITMVVAIPGKVSAAKLLMQLKGMEYFENVEINVLAETVDESTGKKISNFTVNCWYPVPVEEAPESAAAEEGEAAAEGE